MFHLPIRDLVPRVLLYTGGLSQSSLSEGAEVKIAKMAFSSSSLLVVRPVPFEKEAPKQSSPTLFGVKHLTD